MAAVKPSGISARQTDACDVARINKQISFVNTSDVISVSVIVVPPFQVVARFVELLKTLKRSNWKKDEFQLVA